MTITPVVLFSLSPLAIALIVIAVVLIGVIIFLAVWGSKQQKKMEASQKEIEAAAQTMTMLVIDKKKMKFKEAGLPKVVVDATPKYARRAKVPIVKAKIGPKVMTLIADNKIYDMIPVKQEVKATISGIYITNVRSLRGPALVMPKKRSWMQKMKDKVKGDSSPAKKKK